MAKQKKKPEGIRVLRKYVDPEVMQVIEKIQYELKKSTKRGQVSYEAAVIKMIRFFDDKSILN